MSILHFPIDRKRVESGAICDTHPTQLAVAKLTDPESEYGRPFRYSCQFCLEAHVAQQLPRHPGYCEWCNVYAEERQTLQDFEESTSHPQYCCVQCIMALQQFYLRRHATQ